MSFDYKPIKTGATVFSGFAFKSSDLTNEGIPVIKIGNLQNRIVDYTNTQFFPLKKITDKHLKFFLNDKDVLIAMTGQGSVGRVGRIRIRKNKKLLLNQRVGKFVADNINLYNDYLYYILSSPAYGEILFNAGSGSGQPNLSPQTILSVKIPFPSITEQKAIAATLSCIDDKIELNNRINKTLEEMAQAIFKSWFVDFEPFQDGEFEDSELGSIPKEWRVDKLKSICKTITKGTTPTTLKKKFIDSGINFLKAESITDNHFFDCQKVAYIDEETNEMLKRSILHENDILLTIAGTIGRYAIVTDNILPANTNQAIGIIRIDEKIINPLYILNLFMCNCHKEFLESKVVQAVQANLSLGVIGDLPVVIPDKKTLKGYYAIINPIFYKKQELNIENQNLIDIRDSLLPKLMSGEIRVPPTGGAING